MQNAGINIEIEVSQNNFSIKSTSLYFETVFLLNNFSSFVWEVGLNYICFELH